MILFHTRSAQHLAQQIPAIVGRCMIKQFSDGEIYVKVLEDVANKPVWVLAATPAPGDNIIELIFLLDALQRCGAKIHLLLTYFGYARQDRAEQGEALGAAVISALLKHYVLYSVQVVHAHSDRLHDYLNFKQLIPFDHYSEIARSADIVVAPDTGAGVWAQEIAKQAYKELLVIKKSRPEHEQVAHANLPNPHAVHGRKILIVDDMISTGRTVIAAAELLKSAGAREIAVAATHGIFTGNALEDFTRAPISSIAVSNSLPQIPHPKITVFDLSPWLTSIMEGSL